MKILVAEDEPQLVRVLTVAMEHAGYDVDQVDNGLWFRFRTTAL